jgi:hypothetical protein
MPIEIGLWKMGAQLEPVRFQPLEDEKKLEAALATDLSLVGEGLLNGAILRHSAQIRNGRNTYRANWRSRSLLGSKILAFI